MSRLIWLQNGPKEITERTILSLFDQTAEEAVQIEKEWRADKVIGDPKITKKYSVESLKGMGIVGIYRVEQEES